MAWDVCLYVWSSDQYRARGYFAPCIVLYCIALFERFNHSFNHSINHSINPSLDYKAMPHTVDESVSRVQQQSKITPFLLLFIFFYIDAPFHCTNNRLHFVIYIMVLYK